MKKIMTLKIVIVITVALLPSLASSQETYKFERMWPTLKQPWYFVPHDVAVDGEGNFYVVSGNHGICIQKFNADGIFIKKWCDSLHAEGVAVDAEGYIYVAWFNYIRKFDSDLNLVWQHHVSRYGGGFHAREIAVDADGNIYVGGQKLDSEGNYISQWGAYGGRIAIDADGYFYGTGPCRIRKFDSDGNFILEWGSCGRDPGEFRGPSGIAAGKNGYIYVADIYNANIQKFDTEGTFISMWGGDGQFYSPRGITVDVDGNVYAADWGNHSIQKFTPNGTFISKWGNGTGDGFFHKPGGIAVDADGYVYVVGRWNSRIQKFDLDGNFITKWDHILGNGITLDRSGNIYVTHDFGRDHSVQKFTSNGTLITQWGILGEGEGEFRFPGGIAVDADGYVYVVDRGNSRIQKFDSEGNFILKWGDGRFSRPNVIAIDADGYFYVTDSNLNNVQKFDSEGNFILKWGSHGFGDGQFHGPFGIGIDSSGFVFVVDKIRVQKFDSDGNFITKWGSRGVDPGQFNGWYINLAVSPDGRVYVADELNNRIQVFKKVVVDSNPRAIVVAGGGPYAGNSLWDATQLSANFAYRTLTYRGFIKDDIYYLSADTDLDLDGNGVADDVDGDATIANLQHAITQWAKDEKADSLTLYLNDHGGPDTFRMSETETLPSSDLASWLDALQPHISGRITVVYDACASGSFIDNLRGDNRIIVTSTLPGEQAKFLGNGTLSFSSFFWTHIFNGLSIDEAHLNASQVINFAFSNQNPQLSGEAEHVYIGSGIENIIGEAPEIGSVSEPQEIDTETSAGLYAENVTDPDGISRVWAIIWPPDYSPGSVEDPLLSLPTLDLLPVGGGRYEGTFDAFIADGTYQIAIYAMDGNSNTSIPMLTSVSRNYHVVKKAVIVAGGEGIHLTRPMIEKNAGIAYDALKSQLYTDEDIYLMSATSFRAEVDVGSYLSNLENYLNNLASDGSIENLDLVVYLIGEGNTETFKVNDDDPPEILTASDLNTWLDNLQNSVESRVTIIYDADKSGSFIPVLTPPEGKDRILIASSGDIGAAYFNPEGNICFSSFFWSQVANGETVYNALSYAKKAISYLSRKKEISFSCYKPQSPLLDANCNGVANEEDDYQIARGVTIGIGMKFADDPPQIGAVSVEEAESVVTISAWDITSTKPLERVWAAIKPIGYCPGYSGEETAELPEVELLDPDQDGRYEGTYSDPINCYKINIYAMDVDGNTSLPKETKIYQTEGGDIYEVDDTRSQANVIVIDHLISQPHNFHYAADEDWVKFYGLNGEYYTILAENLGDDCEPIMELYYEDDEIPIEVEGIILNNTVSIDFECLQDGVYYVKLYNITDGEETGYDLQIYHPYWPDLLVLITGRVADQVSWEGIDGAFITTSGGGAAISVGGEYDLYQKPGVWTMAAQAHNYAPFFDGITLNASDQIIGKDIIMEPISSPSPPECKTSTDCNDRLFCNGIEMCIRGKCYPGTNPCPDDDLFCNGDESCDEGNNVCLNTGNPCAPDLTCDEDNDVCVGCLQDADCDDGLFCSGVETCVESVCQQPGAEPCPDDGLFCNGVESCDEENDVCLNPGNPCSDDGQFCNGEESCDENNDICLHSGNPCSEPTPVCDEESNICVGAPVPTILFLPDTYLQSRWIPLPVFIRIEGADTHFDASTTVTFNPAGAILALPLVADEENILCIGLLMPLWFSPVKSIDVMVATGSEESYGTLNIELLPFILDEGR